MLNVHLIAMRIICPVTKALKIILKKHSFEIHIKIALIHNPFFSFSLLFNLISFLFDSTECISENIFDLSFTSSVILLRERKEKKCLLMGHILCLNERNAYTLYRS